MKLKNKIILSVLFIVFIPLILSYYIFLSDKINTNSENIEKNLYEVSKLIVNNKAIKESIEIKNLDKNIELLADEYVNTFRDVDIIVVVDIDGVKYSHLDKNQIGQNFVNPIQWDKIKNREGYFSKMKGSMGITYRRFEPIFSQDNNEVIGLVMTGKYYDTIAKMNHATVTLFLLLFSGSIIVSILLAISFANRMKKTLLNLEPHEIRRLYNEEKLIVDNLESGVIALDSQNKILKVNSIFNKKFAGITPEDIMVRVNKKIQLSSNKEIKKLEFQIKKERIFVKVLPIYNVEEYIGSTLIIERYDDVDRFAREITGIDHLVDGMRANIHEFKNRLHVILGLINLSKYDLAKKYILEVQDINEYDFKKLKNIKNSFIRAVLMGKGAVGKERGINLVIEAESEVLQEVDSVLIRDLATILSNLIENAFDSFINSTVESKEVRINISESENEIDIFVSDNGEKIPEDNLDKIYKHGYSTKGENRGIGLVIVKDKLSLHSGTIAVEQTEDYKTFKIKVVKKND